MTLRFDRFERVVLITALAASCAIPASPAHGQRPDSMSFGTRADSAQHRDTLRPPLSPRRAFLYSAAVPGYSQSVFGRHRAAALMLLVEAISIAMITESAADVHEARRMRGDSVVISYVGLNGEARSDIERVARRFDDAFVRTRESHLEDWIAFLIANHLFSAADAYVAASLWDVPAQLSIRVSAGQARVAASLSW